MTEIYEFKDINVLLSTLCVAFLSAIIFLFKENRTLTADNKKDLKLFDDESKKSNKELLDVLNKFYLAMEKEKMSDDDTKKKIQRIIDLLEKRIDNG